MTDREKEKLVELLYTAEELAGKRCDSYPNCDNCPADNKRVDCMDWLKADCLLSLGVTVHQEAKLYWKPVKPGEWNLTCSACDSHLGCRENANFCPECGAKFVYPKAVAPQPPKE